MNNKEIDRINVEKFGFVQDSFNQYEDGPVFSLSFTLGDNISLDYTRWMVNNTLHSMIRILNRGNTIFRGSMETDEDFKKLLKWLKIE